MSQEVTTGAGVPSNIRIETIKRGPFRYVGQLTIYDDQGKTTLECPHSHKSRGDAGRDAARACNQLITERVLNQWTKKDHLRASFISHAIHNREPEVRRSAAEAVARLKLYGILTIGDLDEWRGSQLWEDEDGPYIPTRRKALIALVGRFAAETILEKLAAYQCAR